MAFGKNFFYFLQIRLFRLLCLLQQTYGEVSFLGVLRYPFSFYQLQPYIRLLNYSSEVWICLGQTYPKVYRNMFRINPRATLGRIIFTMLIQKSGKKQWNVLRGCLEKFPQGSPEGNQTFLSGA